MVHAICTNWKFLAWLINHRVLSKWVYPTRGARDKCGNFPPTMELYQVEYIFILFVPRQEKDFVRRRGLCVGISVTDSRVLQAEREKLFLQVCRSFFRYIRDHKRGFNHATWFCNFFFWNVKFYTGENCWIEKKCILKNMSWKKFTLDKIDLLKKKLIHEPTSISIIFMFIIQFY